MEKLGDNIKKILLAGIGAVAVTAEKSKDLLDEMVEKGELTVEQGKVLNEELKHNIKKTVKEKVNVSVKPSSAEELRRASGENEPGADQGSERADPEDGERRGRRRRAG